VAAEGGAEEGGGGRPAERADVDGAAGAPAADGDVAVEVLEEAVLESGRAPVDGGAGPDRPGPARGEDVVAEGAPAEDGAAREDRRAAPPVRLEERVLDLSRAPVCEDDGAPAVPPERHPSEHRR